VNEGARKLFGPPSASAPTARLGFGAWAIGGSAWGEAGEASTRQAAVSAALDGGVTCFDTAPSYGAGESERILGQALRPHRDRVVIATKVGPRDDPRRSLEDSLRRLGSEYVDLIQLHEPLERWEWALETLDILRHEGKARAIGICNATHLQLARATAIAPIAALQAAYNLFDRDVQERDLPYCREHELGFLAYRSLAAGFLTGKYDAPPSFTSGDHRRQIYWFRGPEFERRRLALERLRPVANRLSIALPTLALRWLLARPGITVVLAGARNPEQVRENLLAEEAPLPPDAVAEIDDLVARVFRLPHGTPAARAQAASWGPREQFIVERLDGTRSAEAIAAEWTDRGEQAMTAAQVKVFADALREAELAA